MSKPTQGACRGTFGREVASYYVGESALHPGQVQVCQYSSRLVGPLSPAQARELAANIIAAADALEARSYCPTCGASHDNGVDCFGEPV